MKTDNYQISAPIEEVIDIINNHKPAGNIYNGCNSVEERTDEKITNVLDDVIADIVNSYPERTANDILNLNSEYHGCVLNAAIRSAMQENGYTTFILKYAIECLPFLSDSTLLIAWHDCVKKFKGNWGITNGDIWKNFYNVVLKEMEKRGSQ